MDLSATTQQVPFYPWRSRDGAGFGSVFNDWQNTTGDYRIMMAIPMGAMSIFPAIGLSPPTHYYGLLGSDTPSIASGEFQNYMGNCGFGCGYELPNDYPLMTDDSSNSINFSQPLFYYFGLRPGETSYNTFIRLYVDEELAGTVV